MILPIPLLRPFIPARRPTLHPFCHSSFYRPPSLPTNPHASPTGSYRKLSGFGSLTLSQTDPVAFGSLAGASYPIATIPRGALGASLGNQSRVGYSQGLADKNFTEEISQKPIAKNVTGKMFQESINKNLTEAIFQEMIDENGTRGFSQTLADKKFQAEISQEAIDKNVRQEISQEMIGKNVTGGFSQTIADKNFTAENLKTIADNNVAEEISQKTIAKNVTAETLCEMIAENITREFSQTLANKNVAKELSQEAINKNLTEVISSTLTDETLTDELSQKLVQKIGICELSQTFADKTLISEFSQIITNKTFITNRMTKSEHTSNCAQLFTHSCLLIVGLREKVMMGNKHYSVGQKYETDNNKNLSNPKIDKHIANTYAAKSSATNKQGVLPEKQTSTNQPKSQNDDKCYVRHSFKLIDLFSGTKGINLGSHQTNFRPVSGFDIDATAPKTYATNFKSAYLYSHPIEDVEKHSKANVVIRAPLCRLQRPAADAARVRDRLAHRTASIGEKDVRCRVEVRTTIHNCSGAVR